MEQYRSVLTGCRILNVVKVSTVCLKSMVCSALFCVQYDSLKILVIVLVLLLNPLAYKIRIPYPRDHSPAPQVLCWYTDGGRLQGMVLLIPRKWRVGNRANTSWRSRPLGSTSRKRQRRGPQIIIVVTMRMITTVTGFWIPGIHVQLALQ